MANNMQAEAPRFGLDRNSPLVRFWCWWTGELAASLPKWLRQTVESPADFLLVAITPETITFSRRIDGQLVEQGRAELQAGELEANSIAFQTAFNQVHRSGENVALLLAGNQCLCKQVELPLAAMENLRQVIGFEMDRHTPFKAGQVYFGFRIQQQDDAQNKITLRLAVAPRQAVDGPMEQLSRWGAPVRAVYMANADNEADAAINLIAEENRPAAVSTGLRKLNWSLFALVLGLGMAAILVPIWQKRAASIELIPQVEQAKQQAMEIENIRHQQEKLAAEYNFPLNKKQEVAPAMAVLEEISALLPDDTWVQNLTIKGKELQIQGETESSAKLIPLIESSKLFHNSSFRSPLTKGTSPDSERYQLVAEIKPMTVTELMSLPPSPVHVQPQSANAADGASQPDGEDAAQAGDAPDATAGQPAVQSYNIVRQGGRARQRTPQPGNSSQDRQAALQKRMETLRQRREALSTQTPQYGQGNNRRRRREQP